MGEFSTAPLCFVMTKFYIYSMQFFLYINLLIFHRCGKQTDKKESAALYDSRFRLALNHRFKLCCLSVATTLYRISFYILTARF